MTYTDARSLIGCCGAKRYAARCEVTLMGRCKQLTEMATLDLGLSKREYLALRSAALRRAVTRVINEGV